MFSSSVRFLLPILFVLLSVLFVGRADAFNLHLSDDELSTIAGRIYTNECGSQPEKLLWWNRGEAFPSLGIGHFIWYPEGVNERFEESFPALIKYISAAGVEIPKEFRQRSAIWPNKQAFEQERELGHFQHLQRFLLSTQHLQAQFILQRASRSWGAIIAAADESEQVDLRLKITRLLKEPGGPYALIDYVNFKGEGLKVTERYKGQGWGLYQVLQAMTIQKGERALPEFQRAAVEVLTRRAKNSGRDIELEQWLPGWTRRIAGYDGSY